MVILQQEQLNASKIRNQYGGAFIVELLVAVLIASVMGTAIVNSMSDSLRVSTRAQSQVLATTIAQQVIDGCRNRAFDELLTPAGAGGCLGNGQTLVVNGTGGTYPALFPRSLVMDLNDNTVTWNSETRNNLFRGTVTADVVRVDDNNVDIGVTVVWSENGGQRRYQTSGHITRFGLRSN